MDIANITLQMATALPKIR